MSERQRTTLIKNATIIDGTGKKPYLGSVMIKDGKIHSINKNEAKDKTVDETVNANGMYLLPGMIDCHVHVMINQYNFAEHLNTPFSLNFYKSINNMGDLVRAGITSARDAGGADLGVKKAQELGLIKGPKLKISITPLSITGGHMDGWRLSGMETFILNPPYPGNPMGICDGIETVRRKVREVLRAGADVIKVCSTGGVMSPTDHPDFEQFSIEELRIMVEESNMRKGIKVMAHAQGLKGIKNAIRSGVHSIEHGVALDDEAIDLMLENKVFLVPTLLAIDTVLNGNYPDHIKEQAKYLNETHLKSIEKAHKAGVSIAMGTDSGIVEHGRNLEELKLMLDIGMDSMQAIKAATLTAAECLGIQETTGTVEAGKAADLILMAKDPVKNIGHFSDKNNLKAIWQEGVLID